MEGNQESTTVCTTVCTSVFKSGESTTTVQEFTNKWIELIHTLEKETHIPLSHSEKTEL